MIAIDNETNVEQARQLAQCEADGEAMAAEIARLTRMHQDMCGVAGKLGDEVEKLRGLLRQAVETYDNGGLQMSSHDIDGGEDKYNDPYPPHPWHEEWLSYVRSALADANG